MTSMLGLRAGLIVLARTSAARVSQSPTTTVATWATSRTATARTAHSWRTYNIRYASTEGRKSNQVERSIRIKSQARARKRIQERLAAAAAGSEGSQRSAGPVKDASQHAEALAGAGTKREVSHRTDSTPAPTMQEGSTLAKQKKASRPSKGAKLLKDDQGRLRVVRSESRSIRDSHFKVTNRLEHLIANRELTPVQAFEQAQKLVESTPAIMRREPRIYNLYVRHALRAGKKRGAFKIIESMKKNGCAVTGQTYIAVFSNLQLHDINPKQDSILFQKAHSLYLHMLNTWRTAQEYPTAPNKDEGEKYPMRPVVKPNARRVSVDEDGRGYKWYDPRFLTGKSYEKTAKESYEALLQDPDVFVRACDEYVCLLLKHDDIEKVTEMLIESDAIVQNSRSKQVECLPRVLASRILDDHKQKLENTSEEGGTAVMGDEEASASFESLAQRQELHSLAAAAIERHRALLKSIGNDDVDIFRSRSRTRQGGESRERSTPSEHRRRTIISDRIDADGPPGFNPYGE